MSLDLPRLRVAAQILAISEAADGKHEYVIRQAANGNQEALAYILRNFIQKAKQRRALDPQTALVADVFERVLAGENIGKLLGTQAKRGRPRKDENAILIHAMVRYLMLLRSLRAGRTQRRGDDPQAAVAEALGIPPDTVRENYKRASKLIRRIKDNPFFNSERKRFAPEEELYLRHPENIVFLENVVKPPPPEWRMPLAPPVRVHWSHPSNIKRAARRLLWATLE